MSSTIKQILTILGMVTIACIPTQVSASRDAPAIVVSEKTFHFGELSEKTPVVRDFVIKNGGKATLNIKDVQPS